MAVILEGTAFENAIEDKVQVSSLVYSSKIPDSILINVKGTNPGFTTADTVTYLNEGVKISGKVWYVYQGATSFNLYVKHPNPASLAGKTGGTVQLGVVSEQVQVDPKKSETLGFESAATLFHQGEENETIETPNGQVIAGEDPIGPKSVIDSIIPAELKSKIVQYKVPILIGLGVLVAIMLRKALK
jgi:hypothetical protein